MKKRILMPLPSTDFDPTESGVPWRVLTQLGFEVIIATPSAVIPICDLRMLDGHGLGVLAPLLMADQNGQESYREMAQSPAFQNPLNWQEIEASDFDGLILAGGHAKGMREYLESEKLQRIVGPFFELARPVGAICHGVLLAARSRARNSEKSVLWGRKTTSLLASQELLAWGLTCTWLKDYYRTYPQTVETEVRQCLRNPVEDFLIGPFPFFRDQPKNLSRGFIVQDCAYVSARWPGDAFKFAATFAKLF